LRGLPKNGDYIIQWRGERIDDCNTLAFQTAVKAAKVDPLRWHDLRHCWASWAVQSGVTLHELMLPGGWRSFPMVLRYAHFAPDHLALAAPKVRLKHRTKTGTLKNADSRKREKDPGNMVVREGLEPVGDASEISNLLIFIAHLSPEIPLDPQIWHSIWHWHRWRDWALRGDPK
jgi:hypothetical protein